MNPRLALTSAFALLATTGPALAAPVGPTSPVAVTEACEGLDATPLPDGFLLCTHGDDEHLAAAAGTEPTRVSGSVPARREACLGDGLAGPRVQVLYVHGGEDRSGALMGDLLRWTRQVEWTVSRSAEQDGGRRHVRFVTTYGGDGGCIVDVRSVALPPSSLDDFSRTVAALRDLGHDEPDRKYLLFVDSDRYCGLASAPRDDRATADNTANRTSGYARVDRRCWDTGDRGFASTAAHELLHTLGAVQDSAPNATGHAHCTDEHDAMCYADGEGVNVRVRCRDGSSATSGAGDHQGWLLDCGGDDYFHAGSASGYLASHWNTADSAFLSSRGSDGPGHRGMLRPDVPRDPKGRHQTWPGALGGAHRPALAGAHGWEACDLPIEVHVAEAPDSGEAVGDGLDMAEDLATGRDPDPALDAVLPSAVAAINDAVGRTVLRYSGEVADGTPAAGELHLRWRSQSRVAHGVHTESSVRIRSATVGLSLGKVREASTAARRTYVLHALAQGLGLGTVPAPRADLMAAAPVVRARTSTAFAALRHLYGAGACREDRRLDTVLVLGSASAVEPPAPTPALVVGAVDVRTWASLLLGLWLR